MDTHAGAGQSQPQGDGWTTIPRGKRRTQNAAPKAPGSDKDITLEKLTASYKQGMQVWRASACRRQIRQILDRKQPDSGWQIKRAMCFGTGSFCRDNWECQRRSMTQLVAFLDIVEHLQSTSDRDICIASREPHYTPLDVEFLATLNVASCTESKSDYRINGASDDISGDPYDVFVFEAFVDKVLPAVQHILAPKARVFIGTSSPTTGASNTSAQELKEIQALYQKFDIECSSYYFPPFEEDPNVFEGLRICWRNESDND